MVITSVSSSTFDADSTIFLRDKLRTNITDPISATRPAGQKFVMTAYPKLKATYPLITIKSMNAFTIDKLGVGSELHELKVGKEIRVWARNEKEKSEIFQEIVSFLASIEHDNDGTISANLNDFVISSVVNVDEEGEEGTKSKVMEVEFMFILGAT